jgi:hypothetical protein
MLTGGAIDMDDIETRVAVLEQIARSTEASLLRLERATERITARQVTDFRWIISLLGLVVGGGISGFVALLGVMAHGFKWVS